MCECVVRSTGCTDRGLVDDLGEFLEKRIYGQIGGKLSNYSHITFKVIQGSVAQLVSASY